MRKVEKFLTENFIKQKTPKGMIVFFALLFLVFNALIRGFGPKLHMSNLHLAYRLGIILAGFALTMVVISKVGSRYPDNASVISKSQRAKLRRQITIVMCIFAVFALIILTFP